VGPGRAIGFGLALAACLVLQACNPFAPGLNDVRPNNLELLGDRHSVNGLFQYFRNTYELRDTNLYGRMIAPDFRFQYKDFSNNNYVYWGRDQEMLSTFNLFRNVKSISLIWNNYTAVDTTTFDTLARVERFYNIQIVQSEAATIRGYGTARITLTRPNRQAEWRVHDWEDKTDF
jgi:hypothetical protein